MSEKNTTHFQFDFAGILLELDGERAFVERMYRQIMADIEHARSQAINYHPESKEKRRKAHIIWVHRCTDLVRKVYMASEEDMLRSKMLRVFDPGSVATIYIDEPILRRIMPQLERGQTLWAELTQAGRSQIAAVTGANPAVGPSGRAGRPQVRFDDDS